MRSETAYLICRREGNAMKLVPLLFAALLVNVSAQAASGMLYIKSEPPGAAITIGGKDVGKTPMLVRGLPIGETRVTLTIPEIATQFIDVDVKAGKVASATVKLTIPTATLTVITEPLEAEVHIDRKLMGRSPVTLEGLPAGEREIIVYLDGYTRVAQRHILKPGKSSVVEIALKRRGDRVVEEIVLAAKTPDEDAAKKRWAQIRSPVIREKWPSALAGLAVISAFERDHGGTRCFARHRSELTRIKAKLVRSRPVYLADLQETVDNAFWFVTKKHDQLDYHIVSVNGTRYPNGLATHPRGGGTMTVTYQLDAGYSRFLGWVALNDSRASSSSPLTFSIVGDRKTLWRSTPVRISKKPQAFSISVKGVKVLKLRVACPGSYVNAHAVWIEPQLRLDPDVKPPPAVAIEADEVKGSDADDVTRQD